MDYGFNYWFVGCLQYCASNPNDLWDQYVWDIYAENIEWKSYYKQGVDCVEAVNKYFVKESLQ